MPCDCAGCRNAPAAEQVHDWVVAALAELDHDDESDDAEDWLDMLCRLRADGQCGQAGSEFCDFECRRWEVQD